MENLELRRVASLLERRRYFTGTSGTGRLMTKAGQRASAPGRLLKYWSVPRVEAEGVDGKERMRRIPAADYTEGLTQPAAPSDSRPKGCVEFGVAGVARLAEIAADIGTAFAPWRARKLTATGPTPVFNSVLRDC